MLHHVDMTSMFSSGPLTQIMINYIPKFLEGVIGLISPFAFLTNSLFDIVVDMDNVPSELHYRGDDQGTLAVVADG